MNEGTKGFKTAVFGGFAREDVLQYIEKAAQEAGETQERLEGELAALRADANEKWEENVALSEKNADLLERMGEMTLEIRRLEGQLDEQARTAEESAAQIRELRIHTTALEGENASLSRQVATLSGIAERYENEKERMAEIELAAHRRADETRQEAVRDAQRVRVQSAEVISRVRHALETFSGRWNDVVAHAVAHSADYAQHAREFIARMDETAGALDEAMLGELEKGGEGGKPARATMQDVLGTLPDEATADGGEPETPETQAEQETQAEPETQDAPEADGTGEDDGNGAL